jgi:cation diffusion facilitator CzcD-associated flavoprotein CzcO
MLWSGVKDVIVIGAGQAGLSSARYAHKFGLDTVVLDAEDGPGGAWRHRSPTLTMDKVHGIFDLPGFRRPTSPDGGLPAAQVVSAYYADYEKSLDVPVLRPVRVRSVTRADEGLLVDGRPARAVINATGTWRRPYWPYYPGAPEFTGRQLHYTDYQGPAEFAGLRVAVVGGGNSAAHVLSELAGVASKTFWLTRRPPVFRTTGFDAEEGRVAVAMVAERVSAGLPPQSVVSVTGLGYTAVVREALAKGALERLPMFSRITPDGAVWADGHAAHFDVIVWATGFRSALDHLAPLKLREPGGGIQMEGTRVLAEPRLHLVGYGPSASTIGANRAGRAAALEIRDLLESTENRARTSRIAPTSVSRAASLTS